MNTEQILDSTLTLVQSAGKIVADAEKPLSVFLSDLEQAGKDVKIAANDTKAMIRNLDNSLSGISPAVEQFNKACAQINEIVYFKKHDLEIIFNNLKIMSANLEQLSEDLKTYPGSIIYSSPPGKQSEVKN